MPFPTPSHPFQIYSSKEKTNFKLLYVRAIKSANRSLYLSMFSLTDRDLLRGIDSASHHLEKVRIHYDPKHSNSLENLPLIERVTKSKCRLMHHKILVVDDQLSFIGTTNLTPPSLFYHNNLTLGIQSPVIAAWLTQNAEKDTLSFTTKIEDRILHLYLMPDRKKEALTHLIQTIDNAKISIEAALFSLTHKEIIAAFERALARGVNVHLVLDKSAINAKVAHLPIKEYKGMELMHQKCCLIDKEIAIIGSVNWSESGFKFNKDIMLILENLPRKEIKKIARAIRS